jgi:hypothetical protein
LTATITLEPDMFRAVISGRSMMPKPGSKTPAAMGQGESVVADGPAEVLPHLAQGGPADVQRGGDVERVGAHEHDAVDPKMPAALSSTTARRAFRILTGLS